MAEPPATKKEMVLNFIKKQAKHHLMCNKKDYCEYIMEKYNAQKALTENPYQAYYPPPPPQQQMIAAAPPPAPVAQAAPPEEEEGPPEPKKGKKAEKKKEKPKPKQKKKEVKDTKSSSSTTTKKKRKSDHRFGIQKLLQPFYGTDYDDVLNIVFYAFVLFCILYVIDSSKPRRTTDRSNGVVPCHYFLPNPPCDPEGSDC